MDSEEPSSRSTPPPSQPGLAVLFAFLIYFAEGFAQGIVLAIFYGIELYRNSHLQLEEFAKEAQFDGTIFSLSMVASTMAGVPLIWLAARRIDANPRDFLALRMPTVRSFLGWLVILIAFTAITESAAAYFRPGIEAGFTESIYNSTHPRILLWITLLLAIPLNEELLFRGLLFRGLAETPLRSEGAAIVSSFAWAALHVQNDLYLMTSLFVTGLLLATARHYSRSTVLCIFLNSVMNLITTVELLVTTQGG